MRNRDAIGLALILVAAALLRVWAPWDAVFGGPRVNFLETDAWYHVRIVENQVRHFPRHLTTDPYASPDGQYVAVAPLFDTAIATFVFVTQGTGATTAYIERVAAFAPAVMGVLAIVAVFALATVAFDRRAGLIGAAAAAILPGHFLDRTEIGFVDHHALEVLLAMTVLAALAFSLRSGRLALGAGIVLGLYLLSWSSGAYLVAILTLWVVLMPAVALAPAVITGARSAAVTAAVALAVVVAFQDPNLFRYNTQVASLSAMLIVSLMMTLLASRILIALGVVASVVILSASGALIFAPDLARQVGIDLARFQPDATRMAVLEARPLFLYSGNWQWSQPWTFFGTGFYVGLVATIALTALLWRTKRLDHLLIVVFALANYLATVGQNRFGYYLVPATAVTIGWLCARILDWGAGVAGTGAEPVKRSVAPFQRELSIAIVVCVIAPNLLLSATKTTRSIGMSEYWANTMRWLATSTPEPFSDPQYYIARYGAPPRTVRAAGTPETTPPRTVRAAGTPVMGADYLRASYSVMNWWDQGYWLIQMAHRVPVSNPTQNGAGTSAAFYTATDEAAAMAVLQSQRARYVLVDWELPFRESATGLAGRFQNLADWAGIPTSRFYSVCFQRRTDVDPWTPIWIFREPYYQSMVYRLTVLGGAASAPANNTFVVQVREREDVSGRRFCEAGNARRYATADEARAAAAQRGPEFQVVGLTPWEPAFPTPAITGLRQVQDFRGPDQKSNEAPMVRVFEVVVGSQ